MVDAAAWASPAPAVRGFYNACMSNAFDVCIRGAGIVGQTLALLLARERLKVALCGRAPASSSADVRAYALNAASRQLLTSLRCWPDEQYATPVTAMEVAGDQGGAVRFDAREADTDALTWIVDVPALETRLSEAVGFQSLIERVESPVAAPLTVVCEGRASSTRAEFGVRYETTPYPHTAIAARLRSTLPHGQTARQWFRQGQVVALLPLDGPAGHTVALVWSVPHAEVPALMALSPQEFAHAVEHAAELPQGSLELVSERSHWSLQQSRADRWTGKLPAAAGSKAPARLWALAGDAAHAVHPLAGQGLNLGLGDAQALARVLRERDYWRPLADPKLLRQYERERKAGIWSLGLATDGLQLLFDHPLPLVQSARNWGMTQFDRNATLKSWVTRVAMGMP